MARHQHGIFTEGTRAHHHLELSLHDGVEADAIVEALEATRAAATEKRTNGGVVVVIGLAPALWARLCDRAPDGHGFEGYESPDGRLRAPSTQRDVWVWVHGPRDDDLIDVVRPVAKAWEGVAELVLDLPAFVYHDSRDLTGFIDGTANPRLDEAPDLALVPEGSPGAAGAWAMTMRFVHDLDAFAALPVFEQERVFGRTKADSVELEGDDKPDTAHSARAEVDDDEGNELKVYRRSVPWATASTQGLHFVSFGCDLDRFDLQLRTMYGQVDGATDRLLDFTTPLTGSFWFCPSVDDLDALAPLPPDED